MGLRGLVESRLRLRFMRRDPRVALTVLDEEGWHRHVSLLGRIISLDEDRELRDIDRLSLRYTGGRFRTRDRRRFSAWVVVESWHGWDGAPVAGKNVVRGSSSPVGLASRCPGAAERHPTAQPLLDSRSSADSGC